MIKRVLFLFFCLLVSFYSANASHIAGAEFSYQCTNMLGVYKVTLKVYRNCGAINMCSGCSNPIPDGTTLGCTTSSALGQTSITGVDTPCNGVNFGAYTLPIRPGGTNVYDIIQTCSSLKSICTNCNTRVGGTFAPGIEVYVFEGNVNLSTISSACCNIKLGVSVYGYGLAITNFTPDNFYTECLINRCISPCNSSPVFTNEPKVLVCSGVDLVYNLGAIDPDGDSLSYAFGNSYKGPGVGVTWNPPFNEAYPFPYLGAPNANAPYPAGFRINPSTGDILFRPLGQFVSHMPLEVTQWRLINGIMVNIGKTIRSLQLHSIACSPNKSPIIKIYKNGVLQSNANRFAAYAGQQLCLDIVAEDPEVLSNTPPILADTTDLTWNNPGQFNQVMANATWVANYIISQRSLNGPKTDSFKFCWTPPLAAINKQAHSFIVAANDRFCPINASASKAINILVEAPKIYILDSTKNTFCENKTNDFTIYYAINNLIIQPNNSFTAYLSDLNGNFNNPIVIGTKMDTAKQGSVSVKLPDNQGQGNYRIKLRSSSDLLDISTPYAIRVLPGFSQPIVSNTRDSFCEGLNALLRVLPNDTGLNFKWFKNNQLINAANNDTFYAVESGAYKVQVSNAGCSNDGNTTNIVVHPKPVADFNVPEYICLHNTTGTLNLKNTSTIASGVIQYNWLFSDGFSSALIEPQKQVNDSGIFRIKLVATSTFSCADSLEKTVQSIKPVKAAFSISDSAQCLKNNGFTFSSLSIPNQQMPIYTWYLDTEGTSSDPSVSFSFKTVGVKNIKLLVTTKNACVDSITKSITVKWSPVAQFTMNDSLQCLSKNSFSFVNQSIGDNTTPNILWHFGDGNTSTLNNPSHIYSSIGSRTINLLVTLNNGCKDSIAKTTKVNSSPILSFSINDSNQCLKNNNVVLINTSTNATNYKWYYGDNTTSTQNSPSKRYTNSGIFPISLVGTTDFNCTDTLTKTVNIFPNANMDFTINNANQCLNNNQFLFTNNSNIPNGTATYKWILGENDSLSAIQASKKFNQAGTYSIQLASISNNNCMDTLIKTVRVLNNPIKPVIQGDTDVVNSNNTYIYSTIFQDSLIQTNWFIENGTSLNPQTNRIEVKWDRVGKGIIKNTVTNANNCADSSFLTVNIKKAAPLFAGDINVYPNPTNATIKILSKVNLTDKKYTITNVIGHELMSGKLNAMETFVDLTQLSQGVYLLHIEGRDNQSIKVLKH